MTARSYNGWAAFENDQRAAHGVVELKVAGVEFVGGVLGGDVHDVLAYFWTQWHHRVEPLRAPGCWGHSYRANKNNPNQLSCHASATAADGNAPEHPNGVEASRTLTKAQIAEVHRILAEVPELAQVIHWGGDWHYADGLTPDAMHAEIHDHDLVRLHRVADRIRRLEGAAPVGSLAGLTTDLRAVAAKHHVSAVAAGAALLRSSVAANKGARRVLITTSLSGLLRLADVKKVLR